MQAEGSEERQKRPDRGAVQPFPERRPLAAEIQFVDYPAHIAFITDFPHVVFNAAAHIRRHPAIRKAAPSEHST